MHIESKYPFFRNELEKKRIYFRVKVSMVNTVSWRHAWSWSVVFCQEKVSFPIYIF